MTPKTVFLACTSTDKDPLRNELKYSLLKAGFQVVTLDQIFDDELKLKEEVVKGLDSASISIHLIGDQFGSELKTENGMSIQQYQIEMAKIKFETKPNSKIFIWRPDSTFNAIDEEQESFITYLENSVDLNITYSNVPSPIQLIEDVRSMVLVSEEVKYETRNADIFMISNLVDDSTASEILEMLRDVSDIESLSINQNGEMDYAEFSTQQIAKSKLAVVYFKESSDWAIPFAQQVWKKVGGASSSTPILLIGDENPEENKGKKVNAPRLTSMIVNGQIIPLEIKFQYDKLINA